MTRRLLLPVLAVTLTMVLGACLAAPARDFNQALLPAGGLAYRLKDVFDASELAARTPAETFRAIEGTIAELPAGVAAEPLGTFPYLVTVTVAGDAACVFPDFDAIADKTPGPLSFSVRLGACTVDGFVAEFEQLVASRRGG